MLWTKKTIKDKSRSRYGLGIAVLCVCLGLQHGDCMVGYSTTASAPLHGKCECYFSLMVPCLHCSGKDHRCHKMFGTPSIPNYKTLKDSGESKPPWEAFLESLAW